MTTIAARAWISLGISLAILVSAACSRSPGPAPAPGPGDPIRLGVLYNLTGSQAPLDGPSARGAALAAQEINAAGGVLGRRLELVQYDGQSNTATIAAAARRLVQQDRVAAMLGFSDSDMVMAAAPIAARSGLVFVTSGATSPRLPDQASGHLYLACFGDNVQAAAGAEYAYHTLAAHTAYLLADRGMDYARLLAGYFSSRFTELGGQVVMEDAFKTAPENAFAGLGYDTVRLLAGAITRAGSTDAAAIRDALQATQGLPGITGAITYQAGSRVPLKPVAVVQIKGGRFQLAAQWTPERVPAGTDR